MAYRDGYDGNGGGPVLPQMGGNGSHTPQAAAMRYHVHVLRRRWWLVAIVALTVVAGAWWRARNQVSQYTAEMQLRKMPDRTLEAGWAGFYDLTPEAISAEIQIVQSQPVLDTAIKVIGARLVFDEPSVVRSRLLSYVQVASNAPVGSYGLKQNGNLVSLYSLKDGKLLQSASPGELLMGPGFLVRPISVQPFVELVPFHIVPLDEALATLRAKLRIDQLRNTNILSVKYTSPDPVYSADAANAVGRAYGWYSGRQARQEVTQRKEALQTRLAQLEDSLRLVQQVVRNVDPVAGEIGVSNSASGLTVELQRTKTELRTLQLRNTRIRQIRAALERDTANALQKAAALSDDVPGMRALIDQYLAHERTKVSTQQKEAILDNAPEVKRVQEAMANTIREVMKLLTASLEQNALQEQSYQTRISELELELRSATGRLADTEALRQESEALQRVYLALQEKYLEAGISEQLETGAVEIISDAIIPKTPDGSRQTRSFFFAIIVGIVLGILAAFVLEQMDTRVRDAEDAQRAAAVGVIGMIPELRGDSSRPLAIRSDDHTLGAEAYRKLRTNLRFLRADRPRVIAVTSPSPDEGKSVTAANLALAIAQQGQEVLIIDADLRRPVQHEIFGIERGAGLSDALVGLIDPFDAILPYEELPNLSVMNCGTEAPNPAELLGSDAFSRLLSTLLERYDTVIVDTPPVNLVTDAAVISSVTDGVVLVAEAGRTDRSVLASAVNELRQARGSVLGIVLNRVTPGGRYGRYSGYYSGRMYYKREAPTNGNGDRLTAIKDWVSALI